MVYFLGILLIIIPYFLGKGILYIPHEKRGGRETDSTDHLLTGWIVLIGLAEAVHLGAAMTGQSFSLCMKIFAAGLGVCLAAAAVVLTVGYRKHRNIRSGQAHRNVKYTLSAQLLTTLAAVMILLQVISVLTQDRIYMEGDMTLETVNSFLASDSVYGVNPLTGAPYEGGIPLRLKILCLPSLYGMICSASGLDAGQIVYHIIPGVMLVCGYMVYLQLAGILFPGSQEKRACFLIAVNLIFWTQDYLYGMDGFGALHSGFRGTSIRAMLLLPYTFSLILRRKWKGTVLCILAEACIVWTFYGMGACLFVTAGMYLVEFIRKRRARRQKELLQGDRSTQVLRDI